MRVTEAVLRALDAPDMRARRSREVWERALRRCLPGVMQRTAREWHHGGRDRDITATGARIIIDLGDERVSARGGEARWLTRGAAAADGNDGEGFAVGDDGYAEGWREASVSTRQRCSERCNSMRRALPA